MSTTLSAGTATSGAALSSDTSGILQLQSGSTPTTGITLSTAQSTTLNSAASTAPLVTQINGTEVARIDSTGKLLIGITSNVQGEALNATLNGSGVYSAYVTNSASSNPQGLIIKYSGSAPNSNGALFFLCQDNGPTNRAGFYSNGGLANYSANNTNLSDQRLKKNISLAGNYLNKLNQIPVKTFLFNDQTDTELNLGVIAQDVQAVAPELINTDGALGKAEDGTPYLSIYEADLKYAMLKAIQELSAEVTALKAKVGA